MSETISSKVMKGLRQAAEQSARGKERLSTLDRLKEACDAIAGGDAAAIVGRYLPEAKHHYLHHCTLIRPDRVEEYVKAKRIQDAQTKRLPSPWTGPTAVTLRKNKGLLEYVKVRATEQEIEHDGQKPTSRGLESILETIPDAHNRAQMRLAVGRAEELRARVVGLEKVLREIEPLKKTILASETDVKQQSLPAPIDNLSERDVGLVTRLLTKLLDRCEGFSLSRFGLEYDKSADRVLLGKLKHELVAPEELAALRRIAIKKQ